MSFAAAPGNILLIIADDYGIDGSSLYNTNAAASLPPTPNLAALARQGVLFRNAWANPVCSPTRAALLTGRHGFRTGVGDAVVPANSLSTAEFTLPDIFAANSSTGHQLAHFGKWHLTAGPNNASAPNNIGGWPHYAGYLAGTLPNYTNWTKTVNGGMTAGVTNYPTTDVVNDAIAWIQARGAQPWFAWVAFNAPHTPFHKPPNSLHSYDALSGTQQNINQNPRPYYEAAVEAMDTEIGRLLAAVDRANTHIIFLGDNGTPAQVLQPPFPSGRGKDTLYEGGIRVPLIVAGPTVVQTNRRSDALVHAVDVFGTILELAGLSVAGAVPTNTIVDSRSVVPSLLNQPHQPARLYAEVFNPTNAAEGGRALRDERYKLIRFNDGHDEFYDLQIDPYEGTNLLAVTLTSTQQPYRDRLEFWLGGYSTDTGPLMVTPQWDGGAVSVSVNSVSGANFRLWRCVDLAEAFWAPVPGSVVSTNGTQVTLADPAPPAVRAFYSVMQTGP